MPRYLHNLVLLTLLTLFLTGCGKNEFSLEFTLQSENTDNYDVTYYATDKEGGFTVQAVASIREGKCLLTGLTRRPTMAYVYTRKYKYPLIIYVERGNEIKITGETGDPLEWTVAGNKINDDLTAWRTQHLSVLLSQNTDSVNAAVKNFVEQNPESPVSTILMLGYFNRTVDEGGYVDMMRTLKGEAKEKKWFELMGRSDLSDAPVKYPAKLKSMVMKSSGNSGQDTIIVDGENPVFLAFWQAGHNERKALIDSLKILEKELPDSVRIIADICLDADSITWRNAIRRDSLHQKRLWAPLGLVDPLIGKLQVKDTPFFIVFDQEGNQSYRGKNLNDAISRYRTVLHTIDSVKSANTIKKP